MDNSGPQPSLHGLIAQAPAAKKVKTENAVWRQHHSKEWESLGFKVEDRNKWSTSHDLRGVGSCARAIDMIDLGWAVVGRQPLFIDLSQAAQRHPWATHVRSLVSGSVVYAYELDRTLLPSEHYALLGFPKLADTCRLSATQHRDLTGEAMACPCVCMAILIGLCQLDFFLPTDRI